MTLDLPPDWAELIDTLAAAPWQCVVVIGATDTGKSSFARLLCRRLAGGGERVALLDTDLGQKMIGPPACVTLARCAAGGELQLERMRFVGEASPAANLPGAIAAAARLAGAAEAERLVVNTSGLITGPGIPLKRWKLDALDPDHVIAIARGDELAPSLSALPPGQVHYLRPSPAAQRKSPSLRERNRIATLLAALGECRPVALPGRVVEDLHRSPPPPDTLRLGGLADASGEDRALVLVRWSDYLERAEVWTGAIDFTPRRLRLGMKLSDFGDVPGPFRQNAMSKSLPPPPEV